MGNLDLWNAVDDIDPKFTKPISGRDYSGTSPNPQYLIKLATEKLGPVGHGFGWTVTADGFQQMGDNYLHWCRIRFWWKLDGATGDFEAYGQTKAAYTTSGGKYRVDEDAPKKSLTDAITKALSQLGFAANIFLGRWDDNKYVQAVNEEFRAEERAKPDPDKMAREAKAETDAQAAIMEIEACETLAALRDVWNPLPPHIKKRAEAAKDKRKAEIDAEAAA